MTSFFKNTTESIREAGELLDIKSATLDVLMYPQRALEVSIPLRMDDGSIKLFRGWRVQYNDALGPYKGGIRFDTAVNRDEVTALSALMALKTAALGLPYGGAKGGIIVDPKTLSVHELERLARGYVQAIFKMIGPEVDVPAPDINTNAQIMAWMMDEYSKLATHTTPGSFTGKPTRIGGTEARGIATAHGGYVALREVLKRINWKKDISETTVVVQGFGNVGGNAAKILADQGFKVIGISDREGGLVDASGINIDAVHQARDSAGTIPKNRCYPLPIQNVSDEIECRQVSNEEILEIEADILVPAAVEGVLTKDNASKVQASVVLEMANGPTTREADALFAGKNVVVIPDIIANAGGVVVSYLEWVENRQRYPWGQQKVVDELDTLMSKAIETIHQESTDKNITYRKAALTTALRRINEAMELRGWV